MMKHQDCRRSRQHLSSESNSSLGQHCSNRLIQRVRIRPSEYMSLRRVVPSLRRQKDVGKVEVVTEAARYIDYLHKTLIERFTLCGIPESLKDTLGTDNANELNSQHIMNLVTQMAAKQRAPAANQRQQQPTRSSESHSSAIDVYLDESTETGSSSRIDTTVTRAPTSTTETARTHHLSPARRRELPVVVSSKRCKDELMMLNGHK